MGWVNLELLGAADPLGWAWGKRSFRKLVGANLALCLIATALYTVEVGFRGAGTLVEDFIFFGCGAVLVTTIGLEVNLQINRNLAVKEIVRCGTELARHRHRGDWPKAESWERLAMNYLKRLELGRGRPWVAGDRLFPHGAQH